MKEINKMRECMKQLEALEKQAEQLQSYNEAKLFGTMIGCLISFVLVLVFIVGY